MGRCIQILKLFCSILSLLGLYDLGNHPLTAKNLNLKCMYILCHRHLDNVCKIGHSYTQLDHVIKHYIGVESYLTSQYYIYENSVTWSPSAYFIYIDS